MVKIRASLLIFGKSFSPKAFNKESLVALSDTVEPGDVIAKGPRRGQIASEGYGALETSSEPSDWEEFEKFLDAAVRAKPLLERARAEEFELLLSIYCDEQCNFAFSIDDLNRLASLATNIKISCYPKGTADGVMC